MEKSDADAIAQAILQPDVRAQEELRVKRAREAAQDARKRRVAWFMLSGACVGAALAYYAGTRFTVGVLWGSIAGSAIGWLLTRKAAA